MKIIEFRGHSDDTFGYDLLDEVSPHKRIGGDDHDDCANSTVRAYRVESASTGTAVIVTGVYGKCPGATWSVGLAPDDEDVAIPAWASLSRFRTDGYTTVLTLHVPDDTAVTLVCVDGKTPAKEDA